MLPSSFTQLDIVDKYFDSNCFVESMIKVAAAGVSVGLWTLVNPGRSWTARTCTWIYCGGNYHCLPLNMVRAGHECKQKLQLLCIFGLYGVFVSNFSKRWKVFGHFMTANKQYSLILWSWWMAFACISTRCFYFDYYPKISHHRFHCIWGVMVKIEVRIPFATMLIFVRNFILKLGKGSSNSVS